ncbi:MAG: hypothetical protein M0Q42_01685 [Xanthomonadales bacterium]|nr:hypothetical protein [Xanthomonadales bacterium]
MNLPLQPLTLPPLLLAACLLAGAALAPGVLQADSPDAHNWHLSHDIGMAGHRASSTDLYNSDTSAYYCRHTGEGGTRRTFWPIDVPEGLALGLVSVLGTRHTSSPAPTLRLYRSCAGTAPVWTVNLLATHVVNDTGEFRALIDLGQNMVIGQPGTCTQWLSVQFGTSSQSCGGHRRFGIKSVLAGLRDPDQLFFSNFRDAYATP